MADELLRQKILSATKGIAGTLSDYLLIQLTFWLEFMADPGNPNQAAARATEDFFITKERAAGRQKAHRTVAYLKRRGLIAYSRGGSDPKITAAGKERLLSMFPKYDEKRHWDRKLYLVIYDIPEEKKMVREKLRDYLKKIGCGSLQRSIWITPYDPREVLRKFIEDCGLVGEVLIGDFSEGSYIGGEGWEGLLARIYNLSALNQHYRSFISAYSKRSEASPQILLDFLGILRNDPQLPFELLPKDWCGSEAYRLCEKQLRSQSKNAQSFLQGLRK
jgi:phenylacetic acid degradation operon negative regulatory protein